MSEPSLTSSEPSGVLGVIPARGGSKGIPGKNIRPFLGRPLLEWTIETARASGVFREIALSTDDDDIARTARGAGLQVPFMRPSHLAGDDVPTAPVIRHAVEWHQSHGWTPVAVMVLEPTSPGRQPFHLQEAARLLMQHDVDSVASVSRVPHHYVPAKQLTLAVDGQLSGADGTHVRNMVHRRQELAPRYAFDGVVFACRTKWLLQEPCTLWGDRVLGLVVDPNFAVDLDEPADGAPAEERLRPILRARA